MELTLTRLEDFYGGSLASSLTLGAFWAISMMFSQVMITKVGFDSCYFAIKLK